MMKLIFGSATLAAVAAIPAIAQPAPTHSAQAVSAPHVRVVAGGDKTHSRADVVGNVRDHFSRLDSNRDGFITREESQAAGHRTPGTKREMIREKIAEHGADTGRDGAVVHNRGAIFDRLDSNKDGMLSRQEFAAAPQRTERRVVIKTRGARGMGGMMGGFHGRMFEMADANKDNRVSLQEATDAALRRFDTADLNRDGQLSPEERRQRHQQMRGQRRPG